MVYVTWLLTKQNKINRAATTFIRRKTSRFTRNLIKLDQHEARFNETMLDQLQKQGHSLHQMKQN